MTIEEARALIEDPTWPMVRDRFLSTGTVDVFPKNDVRRLEYLSEDVRHEIALWREALRHAAEWRSVVDGEKVRELKAAYPGVYPEVFRYTAYFAKLPTTPEEESAFLFRLLKLKFPEAYELCCS